MEDRAAGQRVHDFFEVSVGLSPDEAMLEAERCMQCKKPKCVNGCPVNIDIPSFIAEIALGNFRNAAGIIKADNMLPAICGRICPQEIQCEGECILSGKEKPISIGSLERFIADWERAHGTSVPERQASTGHHVAVIGSGPAGLTAAAELSRLGHKVTLFESLHEAGGVLMYGIPEFRLPKEIVRAEVEQVLAMGVEIRLNHLAGWSITVPELLKFDAVLLATGAGLPNFMGIPGEQLNGVYSANEFLTRVNFMHADQFPAYDTPVKRGSRVVVAGGGNVAMDAARVARRLDAEVTLVYRRREEDLPARINEVIHAKEEGVKILACAVPVRVFGETCVTGVECIQMEMCALDETGRPSVRPVDGMTFTIDADMFIEAVGQGPNPLLISEIKGMERKKPGNVVVDTEGRTSIPRIFAAGDVATGAATVIMAMGTAKEAARAIDRMFREN